MRRSALIALLFAGVSGFCVTTNQLGRDGILWQFESAVEYGTFVNGDSWVLAPVTITNMTPEFAGINGWEINPTHTNKQGFTTNIPSQYLDGLRPEMPFSLTTNCTLVKVIGLASETDGSWIKTAAALTVLESALPNGGTNYFRPPYCGTNKVLFQVSDLQTNLLPSKAPPASNTVSLATIASDFAKGLRMSHSSDNSRNYRPSDAVPGYYPQAVPDIVEAMLGLVLNDPIADKMNALALFTQSAIDVGQTVILGYKRIDDGHHPCVRIHAAWAATMLDWTALKTLLATNNGFHEDIYLTNGVNAVLWGVSGYPEFYYWNYIVNDDGDRSQQDPYYLIDGGSLTNNYGSNNAASYQNITSQALKGQALLGILFPQLTNCFPATRWSNLSRYARRWVTNGVWALPDDSAPWVGPDTNNYGILYGTDGAGSYIKGSGRFPGAHGLGPDSGQYKSTFVESMWNTYVANESPPTATNFVLRAGTVRVGNLIMR